jgi:cell division protein FtsL
VVRLPVPGAGWLDRLHPSRVWVALVGALLAGIVFFNVSLLELNGGIAKTSERVTELKRQNDDLRLEVARLGSTERIERRAAALGFYLPQPNEVTYLESEPEADDSGAAAALDGIVAGAPTEFEPASYPPG